MDLYNTIQSIGKIAFGVASLGLVAYLIKLLTEINRNQKEHNLLIKDQFQEREKTRDQQIDFLKLQHQKEADLIRMRADSMVAGMESEKRILEQRILLLQEKMRLEAPADTLPSLHTQGANTAQQDSSQSPSPAERSTQLALEAMHAISLSSAHSLKNSLISLSRGLESLMAREQIGKEEIGKLLQDVRQVDAISHLLGSTSDMTVTRNRPINVLAILNRALSTSTLNLYLDAPGSLPVTITDPLLLEHVFQEIIRNAEIHAPNRDLFVEARINRDTIHMRFSNELSPDAPSKQPAGQAIGLFLIKTMIGVLGGDTKVTVEQKPMRRFSLEISLPRISD
jgi:signal transduction histidine kinase